MMKTYYRVKPEYDALPRFNRDKASTDGLWIAGELYTANEKDQFFAPNNMFDQIRVSSHNTYWFFGARFYDKDYYREDDSDE